MSEEKILTGKERRELNLVGPERGFTKENAKERGHQGGIRSGEVKRRNKTMAAAAKSFLESGVINPKVKEQLREYGYEEEDMTQYLQVVAGMANKASKGDARAADWLISAAQQDIKARELDEKIRSNKEAEKAKREELRLKEKAIEMGQNINLNVERNQKFDDILIQAAGSQGLKEDE
jgi:hypothetical protein